MDDTTVHTVEILKRPGQTLGFYIREGNGVDQSEGVFISRIASGSLVEQNGLLKVSDVIDSPRVKCHLYIRLLSAMR